MLVSLGFQGEVGQATSPGACTHSALKNYFSNYGIVIFTPGELGAPDIDAVLVIVEEYCVVFL